MNNESGSRPASVSSLNICLFVKPTEESLDRLPDGRYGRREQVIGSFVPLLFLIGSTFEGLDWSEDGLPFKERDAIPLEYSQVVLGCRGQYDLVWERDMPFAPESDKMHFEAMAVLFFLWSSIPCPLSLWPPCPFCSFRYRSSQGMNRLSGCHPRSLLAYANPITAWTVQ